MSIAVKQLITRTSQRAQSSQEWLINNPVLYAGEIGIESDTTLVKVGDGEHTWAELGYWSNGIPTYEAGAGVAIENHVISLLLLYEKLRMPNVRIRTAELYGIETSDERDVYTDK